jgi:hypothetical protein
MILAAAMLLASVIPTTSGKTAWMRPDSFHLIVGMKQADAVKALEDSGFKVKPGPEKDQLIMDYADDKSLTMSFRKGRLHAVSFEFFTFVPQAQIAFDEHKSLLRERFGEPRRALPSIILYDDRLPNVMMVLSANPKSEHGRRGLGMLVVRYYDPR